MKNRNLLIAGLGFALALGLAGCGKSEDTSKAASADPASVAPVATVAVASAPAETPAPAAAAASDAAPAATTTAAAAAPAGADNSALGEKTFKSVCFMCHQTGAAGAPVFGNKTDWAPRIAQGKPTLYKHAKEGFTGNNGTMPPRGGNPSLKDNEVEAAVDFMVSKAQ